MPPAVSVVDLPKLEPEWPDAQRHRIGALSLDLTGQGFRNGAVDGRVLVREIYPALRRPDWSTVDVTGSEATETESGRVSLHQRLDGGFATVTELEQLDE